MESDFIAAFFQNQTLHNNWTAITGFVVLVLIHILKKSGLKDKIPSKYVPTVSVLAGVFLAFGDKLLTSTSTNWYETLIQGVIAGVSATGFWELVFKHYFAEGLNAPQTPVTPPATQPVAPPAAPPVESQDPPPVVVDIPPQDPPTQ